MLTLYVQTGCPFCIKTIAVIDELGLTVEYKNRDDAGVVDELIAKGGRSRYPYLVDSERDIGMYESDDIIAHLQQFYGSQ